MLHLRRNSGFSLLELMTVVAIIAILSLIAIPSYKGFQARARQKEGLEMLNNYFTAALSARTEWGRFPGNFKATNYHPVGTVNYRLRADNNPNSIDIRLDDPNCTRTIDPCDCATACPEFKTWVEAPSGAPGLLGIAGVQPNPCGPAITTDTTLRAQVAGWISTSSSRPDKYQIDERKQITMCTDGLH